MAKKLNMLMIGMSVLLAVGILFVTVGGGEPLSRQLRGKECSSKGLSNSDDDPCKKMDEHYYFKLIILFIFVFFILASYCACLTMRRERERRNHGFPQPSHPHQIPLGVRLAEYELRNVYAHRVY